MKPLLTTLGMLAVASSLALAQHKPTPPKSHRSAPEPSRPKTTTTENVFDKVDKDNDGLLSFEEFKTGPVASKGLARAEEYFQLMDKNHDGSVSREEFSKPHSSQPADGDAKPSGPTPEQRFRQLDSNRDGSVGLDEFLASLPAQKDPAKAKEYFQMMDKDHDGKLSLEEFQPHRPAKEPAKPETPPVKPSYPGPEAMFRKLDTDGNGGLSLDEFKASPIGLRDPAKAEEYFKFRDKNGDGKLTLDEFGGPRQPPPGNAGDPAQPPSHQPSRSTPVRHSIGSMPMATGR